MHFVPFHEILSEKEKNALLAQYKVKPYQMPQIKSGDPAVKAIGAKPGDVLKITRKSTTAGEHVTYRYVVENKIKFYFAIMISVDFTIAETSSPTLMSNSSIASLVITAVTVTGILISSLTFPGYHSFRLQQLFP